MAQLEIRNVTRHFGDFVAVDDPVNIFHFCTMVEDQEQQAIPLWGYGASLRNVIEDLASENL